MNKNQLIQESLEAITLLIIISTIFSPFMIVYAQQNTSTGQTISSSGTIDYPAPEPETPTYPTNPEPETPTYPTNPEPETPTYPTNPEPETPTYPTNPEPETPTYPTNPEPETPTYPTNPEPETPTYSLWTANSYWHTKIPDDAALHPNSAEMVNWLITKDGHNNGHPYINYNSWTAPVYEIYGPAQTVDVYDYVHDVHYDVPIPVGAKPDNTADAQLVVIDYYQRKTWDFWNLQYVNGQWRAGAAYEWSIDEDGVSPNRQWTVGGASIPVTAGIIRDEEIEAGYIDHPLICLLHTPKANLKVYPPAATADGQTYDTWAIPEGARIQLNPNLNLDALGLSETAKIIAKAMQEYGIVVKESGGSFGIFAEHTETANWTENLSAILFSIPADWRIIDYSVFGATAEYWGFP